MTRSNKIILGFVFTLLFVAACANPAADRSKAVTGEAATASPQSVAQGEKYLINQQNSKIEFVGSKVVGSQQGSFEKFEGAINYAGQPEKSRVDIKIDMNSIKADEDGLTNHLKTPDFFDVAKYPQSTFTSTEIKPGGEKGATHTITGNLQLHGVTKAITFPATIAVTTNAVTVDSNFSINRKDFGINYTGAADNLIRDEVVLTLKVRAVK
ncbi:MAG TPA: YceI family protein [Pyrinomonadaceae bacterium]|nr:YceI family protein [Pyrinomonadaceae bacterium]